MKYKYIFNSKGDWVAFIRDDGNVFSSKDRQYIGFEEDEEIYSINGEYVGKLKKARGGYEAYRVLKHYSSAHKFKTRRKISSRSSIPPTPRIPTISPHLPTGHKDIFDLENEEDTETIEDANNGEEKN